MPYYTGTANDLSSLRQALIDACVDEGWVWDSAENVLSQGDMHARLAVTATDMELWGRTSLASGETPRRVRIGILGNVELQFPVVYEIFIFDAEVYLVVNHSVDVYQYLAWGMSTVNGMPGTGMWVSATVGDGAGTDGGGVSLTYSQGGRTTGSGGSTGAAIGVSTYGYVNGHPNASPPQNMWAHSDLDGAGWYPTIDAASHSAPVGVRSISDLLRTLPNSWNSEALLLPIRLWKDRPDNRVSLVVELEHARHTRIDNYEPGQIITIGDTSWKVLPWYRKNILARDGGVGIDHTGTFGWAIRYEGP